MVRRLAQRRLLVPIAALALSLLSCGREVTGPENGIFRNRLAMLAFEPVFTGPIAAIDGAGDAVPFEKVRVVLRALDGSIVKDTLVDFPSDEDEISLVLTIPIPQDAPAEGLPLTVAMAYVNAAGDTVFRGGPNPLVARPVGSPGAGTPVTVPVEYDGTGKDAARVAISPKTGTAVAGQTLAFSATAFDEADAPIANTPFVFSTLDPTRATVDPVTGIATWLPVRGTARVIAELPNGERADTATFTVALPAAKLVLGSGGAQVGAVNAPLADTIVVRTLASDDVPVEGVVVTFAVATGAGTLSVLEDTSDANGDVKTVWTLGAPLGAQTITATSAGLTGSPLTITATSQPATPVRLEITQAPGAGIAGVSLTPALSVIARDAFENIVTDFAEPVTVSVLGAAPASLTGTDTRAAVAGTATFDDLAITAGGDMQLVVSSGTLASDTTATFRITAAAASQLAILAQPTAGVDAGVTFAVDVEARDAFGNRDSSFTGSATIAVRTGAVGATLGGVTTRAMVAGGTSFTALTLDRAGSYELEISAPGLTSAVSTPFDILTGVATQLAIETAPISPVVAGAALDAFVVRTENAFGEATLFGDSLRVVVVDGPLGGRIIAGDTVVLADSTATFGGLAFDLAGSYTLEFRGAGLDSVRSAPIAIVAGEPVSVVIVSGDGQTGVVGAAPLAPLAVAVRDAYGNGVAGVATLWFTSSGSSAALDSTDVTTDAEGIARTTLRFGEIVESFAVTASAGDLGSVDFTLTSIAGDATDLVVTAEPGAAIAGAPIGPLTVIARDAFANLADAFVGDVSVAVDSGPAGASLGGTTTVTAIAGSAVFADLALDRAGNYRLRLQAAGLVDTVTTTFTVAAAALADILLVEGDAQTDTVGATLLSPLVIRAVDAFGNPIVGADISWSVSGDVFIGEPSTTTDAAGEASAVATLGTTAGAATVTVALDALPDSSVTFTLTALGGTATQLVVASAPDTVTASVPATIVIHALDVHGNIAPAFTEDVTITAVDAVGPANGVTTVTAVAGVATFDAITFDVLGAYYLVAAAGGLSDGFELRAVAGDPSDLSIVSGDGQTSFTGFQLDAPIVLQLNDANGFPVEDDTVYVTVASGGGVIGDLQDSLALVTDGLGQVSVIWTLGLGLGPQTLSASTATLGPITLTATAVQSVANVVWTGLLNSDAANASNWRNGVTPAPTDSVLVPAGAPNYPVLATTTTYARLTIEDGATLDLGTASLIVTRDIRAPLVGGITTASVGGVTADSAGSISGRMPQLTVNGDFQTAGVVDVVGSVAVQNNATFSVNAGDSLHVGATLSTTNGGGVNQIGGSAMYVGSGGLFLDGGTSTFGAGGRLHLLGSLYTLQSAAPTAFVADSAHELYLLPGATQDIYLFLSDLTPNGVCDASCLGTVISNRSLGQGGIRFLTDAMALGGFQVNVDSIGGNPTYVVAGAPSTLRAPIGGQFRRFGFTGSYDVDAFSADTLVAFGSGLLPVDRAIPVIVAGDYAIAGAYPEAVFVDGSLDVDGAGAAVAGPLRTRGSGYLRMTEPTDSLVLTGDAFFEGTAESGQLTAGVLDMQGSTLSVGSGALLADAGHVMRFTDGGGHSLLVADGTNTSFGSLLITDNTGVTVTGDSVRIAGDLTILGVESQFANVEAALVEVGGRLVMPEGSGLSFTTTVLTGSDAIATPRMFGTLVIRGANTLTDTLLVEGILQVESGGSVVLNGWRVEVDSLFTSGSGTITMANADDSLTVRGTATFAGGVSVLSAGVLRVDRGFTQSAATSLASFAPSGTHLTVLGDSTDLVGLDLPFEIRFDSPDNSWFNELYVAGGWYSVVGTARARGRIDVRDFRQFGGGTLVADSGLYAPFGEMQFQRLSIAGPLTASGVFSADTVEFRGPVGGAIDQSLPGWVGETQIPYRTVVVTGPNVVMRDLGGPYTMGKLDVPSGSLTFGEDIDVLADTATLAVRGSGAAIWAIGVPASLTFDSVYVGTSATLAPTSGSLSLTHFVQEGAANFQPSGSFSVTKNGDGVLSFADPAGAYFHNLFLSTNATATLRSDVTVNGLLTRTAGGTSVLQSDQLGGATRALNANGGLSFLDNRDGGTLMRRVRLNLTGSYASSAELEFNNVRFEQMDPDAAQPYLLTQHGGGIAATWSNIVFDTPVNSALYFQWDAPDDGSSIAFANATPAVGCLVATCVQGQTAPDGQVLAATWTGGVSSQWTDPSNWQGGTLPNAETVVTVEAATFAPEIADGTQLGGLIVSAGAEARIPAVGTITVFGDVDIQGTLQGLDGSSTLLMRPAAISTLATPGEGAIDANLIIDRGIGQVDGVVQLSGNVTMIALASTSEVTVDGGTLDLNGFSFTTPGNFWTTNDGRLQMDAATPVLSVGGTATFSGASTQGVLTVGELRIGGNLVQDSAVTHSSFQSTGSHAVVFVGTGTSNISFASSDDTTGSRIANLRNEKEDGLLLLQNSDLYVDTVVGGWTADFQIAEPGDDFYSANLYVMSRFEPLSQPFGLILGFGGRVFVLSGIDVGCDNTTLLINQGDSANLTPSQCAWIP